jgi:hypothetical protein
VPTAEEAYVTRGMYQKKMDIKGRGRHGIMFKPKSHLNLTLVEEPNHKSEVQKRKEKFINFLQSSTIKYKKIRSFP